MRATVIGAGLAGTECAFQLAERGVDVTLVEQKPVRRTPAQTHDFFAELVCSNSFRGADLANAVGLIKEELRRAGSLVMRIADLTKVPAGGALAVDRQLFGEAITRAMHTHPRIRVVCDEVLAIPDARPLVLATGPLTGDALAKDLAAQVGAEHLAYYDAIAPILAADSIDWDKVFRASRWDKGGDDAYVNCPLDRPQYEAFVEALLAAEKVEARAFEELRYFEGCLPVEVMASRGPRTLSFGPMKPVGLTDPRTGRWPAAVVQLRPEDEARTAYNMVGFQTRMKFAEQKRVFGMIPGLERAEFLRYGSVHRNTFVDAPRALDDTYQLHALPGVYLAGQVAGVEGYVESAACGFAIGVTLARRLQGGAFLAPPPTTALGALLSHLRRPTDRFQPSNVLWSMFPDVELSEAARRNKGERRRILGERALADLESWRARVDLSDDGPTESSSQVAFE
ncbi:MAG: methylenetetrahydrofolate--tRNA-(uracil(54)-C(5))-methyltransferase (FADH(2)-oxidizing) TrmFO [Polyangiales bacterium]